MTLDELRLLEHIILLQQKLFEKVEFAALSPSLSESERDLKMAKFIIEREIKMKVNDPRIFAKDRKDG